MLRILTAKKQLHSFFTRRFKSWQQQSLHSCQFWPYTRSKFVPGQHLVAFRTTSHLPLHTIPYRIPRQLACLRLIDWSAGFSRGWRISRSWNLIKWHYTNQLHRNNWLAIFLKAFGMRQFIILESTWGISSESSSSFTRCLSSAFLFGGISVHLFTVEMRSWASSCVMFCRSLLITRLPALASFYLPGSVAIDLYHGVHTALPSPSSR